MRIEEPKSPLKDAKDGVGFRHDFGQAGCKLETDGALNVTFCLDVSRISSVNCPPSGRLSPCSPSPIRCVTRTSRPALKRHAHNPNPIFEGDVAHHQVEGVFRSGCRRGSVPWERQQWFRGDLAEVVDPHKFSPIQQWSLTVSFQGYLMFTPCFITTPMPLGRQTCEGLTFPYGHGSQVSKNMREIKSQTTHHERSRVVVLIAEEIRPRSCFLFWLG